MDTIDLTSFLNVGPVTVTISRELEPVDLRFISEMPPRGVSAIAAVFKSTSEADPVRLGNMIKDLQALAGSKEVAELVALAGHTLCHLPEERVDHFIAELVTLVVDLNQQFRERRRVGGAWVLPTHHARHLKKVAKMLRKCAEMLNEPLGSERGDKPSVQTLSISEATLSRPVEVTIFLNKLTGTEAPINPLVARANLSLLPMHLGVLNTSMAEAMEKEAALRARDQSEKSLEWVGYVLSHVDQLFESWFGSKLNKPYAELRNLSVVSLGNALRGYAKGDLNQITLTKVRVTRRNHVRPKKTARGQM